MKPLRKQQCIVAYHYEQTRRDFDVPEEIDAGITNFQQSIKLATVGRRMFRVVELESKVHVSFVVADRTRHHLKPRPVEVWVQILNGQVLAWIKFGDSDGLLAAAVLATGYTKRLEHKGIFLTAVTTEESRRGCSVFS
jgi:hypothetical protein